jgi:hypothetical protein
MVGWLVWRLVGDAVGQLTQLHKYAPTMYRDASQGHSANAPCPMLVTESGIVMLARLLQ